eukprot:5154640-Amphidinium_carterae.1
MSFAVIFLSLFHLDHMSFAIGCGSLRDDPKSFHFSHASSTPPMRASDALITSIAPSHDCITTMTASQRLSVT